MCDQGGSNRAAYNKLKVTKEKPYFHDKDGNKVFALLDLTLLFKTYYQDLILSLPFFNTKNRDKLFCFSFIIKQADQP